MCERLVADVVVESHVEQYEPNGCLLCRTHRPSMLAILSAAVSHGL